MVVYAAIVVAVVVLGARYLRGPGAEPRAPAGPPVQIEREQSSRGGVTVHVAGAVRRPGVYRLPPGARVDDAVRRAGGPTRRADLSAVNLAAKPEDGRQVLVPERAPPAGGTSTSTPSAPGAPTQPINLNTATLEQLDTLDGIGPSLAQAILDYREENGGFGSVDELAQVPGIGEKRLATLRAAVTV